MNTKIKCCIVVFILTMLPDWIALLSAQNVYSLADRFATAIDFSFKQSIINKNKISCYEYSISPSYAIGKQWKVGLCLDMVSLIDNKSNTIATKDYLAGYLIEYSIVAMGLGVQQSFSYWSSSYGYYDSELYVRLYYPKAGTSFLKLCAGYLKPYSSNITGFVYLSAGLGINFISNSKH